MELKVCTDSTVSTQLEFAYFFVCDWIDITSIMINDALESLVTAVETERADVIQEVVKTVKKCELLTLYFNE